MQIKISYLCPKCSAPGDVILTQDDLDAGGRDFVCKGCDFVNGIHMTSKPRPGKNLMVELEPEQK